MKDLRHVPSLTRAEIDLSALAHNYRELRRLTSPEAGMMAVVKADGYGHGAVKVSETALACGAEWLAVARMNEVVHLRKGGINAPLLLFGYCFPEYVAYLAGHDTRASVATVESGRLLSEEAGRLGVCLKVHIKVDTGMGRFGVVSGRLLDSGMNEDVQAILDIAGLPHLEIEGIYTHFATADSADKSYARGQLTLFMELLDQLKVLGFEAPLRHAANSAAIIELPESHLDIVRPGVASYGLWPSDEVDQQLIDLRPVMSLKSKVIQVKDVPAGFKVSYGCTHETEASTRIATVPIGYADGYDRILSSQGFMLVCGVKVPIMGRVCMDSTMIDVGAVEGVQTGDEVVVLGQQCDEQISAEEIAHVVKTINYEIVSSITARVEKQYLT